MPSLVWCTSYLYPHSFKKLWVLLWELAISLQYPRCGIRFCIPGTSGNYKTHRSVSSLPSDAISPQFPRIGQFPQQFPQFSDNETPAKPTPWVSQGFCSRAGDNLPAISTAIPTSNAKCYLVDLFIYQRIFIMLLHYHLMLRMVPINVLMTCDLYETPLHLDFYMWLNCVL